KADGLKFNRQVRLEGYAYNWYLTAITGPDYVDRGTPGVLDNQDYGQWISFEYGKWSDSYPWRNPSEGYQKDDDNTFRTVSMGKREVYYLNAVRTRSHAALFEKDVRYDAKSSSPEIFNKNWAGSPLNAQTNYQNEGVYNINSSQSMRLDKIYLLNSSDAGFVTTSTGSGGNYIPSGRSISCPTCEFHNSVLDKFDINAVGRSALEAKAIRIVDFNYDYSLARGTVNSYDITSASSKFGKLTLKSLKFRGRSGQDLLPPTEFEYNLDAQGTKRAGGSIANGIFVSTSGAFEVGDMIETDDVNAAYCGVISEKIQNGSEWRYAVKSSILFSVGNSSFRTTKNPPYHKDSYDLWGMHKADWGSLADENMSRLTTPTSNKTTDAWSLRKIKTGMGADIKIDYEGDTYSKSVLNRTRCFTFTNFSSQGSNNFNLNVYSAGMNLNDMFKVGDEIDIMMLKEGSGNNFSVIASVSYYNKPKITSINGNYLTINCPTDMSNDILYNAGGGTGTVKTGNIKPGSVNTYYGGGIRVKTITVDNLSGTKTTTKYSYNKPNGLLSSGVTSYEPVGLDQDRVASTVSTTDDIIRAQASNKYRRDLYSEMTRLLSISRDVPAPGVVYEYVTVTSEVTNSLDNQARQVPGKVTYQFEVFRENMVGKQDVTPRRSAPRAEYGLFYTRNVVLKKFISNIGALKRAVYYDKAGIKLSETINHYLHDGLENTSHSDFMNGYEQRLAQYRKQGLIKERYSEVKSVWTGITSFWHVKATMAAREEYPAIQTGQTVIDYTVGTRTSSVNLAFDFYSGVATQQLLMDAYGNRFMQEIVPAYKKYPELGLKIQDPLHKNMLAQETGYYTYKVDNANSKQDLVSASVQLWGAETPVLDAAGNSILQNNAAGNGKIWRKTAQYGWMPQGQTASGMTPISSFVDFDWASATQNDSWRKIGEIKRYDVFSKPLESVDFNGLYSAFKLGYNNSKMIVSGSNTSYSEIAVAGFEDAMIAGGKLSSNVTLVNGIIGGSVAHTGKLSLALESNRTGISYDVPLSSLSALGRDYVASIWVHSPSGNLSSAKLYYSIGSLSGYAVLDAQKTARGWTLLQLKIPASALTNPNDVLTVRCANVNGSGTLFFDDFRFQPLQATVNSYVYDPFSGELTHILDNNNVFTRFEYDGAGRLVKVYKEKLGKTYIPLVNEVNYHYKKVQ
uniref:hypothetical protein n=1 Tax=Arcticibacter sp. TaxID=1872630 RepID=UPI00388F5226